MVCPFDNTIVYTKLLGKEIKDMFEYSIKNNYGILQVSKNVKLFYDENKNVTIKIKDKPLLENKLYTVATNNFVASGGDGYVWFTRHKIINTKKLLRDAIKEYFQKNSPVKVNPDQRIVFKK
jgi:2',3'-cyclic-nucleotide 2'-phosphodiesterase (5'-nucleotidase family)